MKILSQIVDWNENDQNASVCTAECWCFVIMPIIIINSKSHASVHKRVINTGWFKTSSNHSTLWFSCFWILVGISQYGKMLNLNKCPQTNLLMHSKVTQKIWSFQVLNHIWRSETQIKEKPCPKDSLKPKDICKSFSLSFSFVISVLVQFLLV